MTLLLDPLNVRARHDIRGQVQKEIGRHRAWLEQLAAREDVDQTALAALHRRVSEINTEMTAITPHFAAHLLRDNELLNSINSRHVIPGGTPAPGRSGCAFSHGLLSTIVSGTVAVSPGNSP